MPKKLEFPQGQIIIGSPICIGHMRIRDQHTTVRSLLIWLCAGVSEADIRACRLLPRERSSLALPVSS
jgi:uncharacterized protein (DUF433 family)